ncbi:uncharacterized protein TNCV_106251 [Trichonephila clavipes]|nr:uncharacterized protein TNCV_106251 [Trichonephila clavipes]
MEKEDRRIGGNCDKYSDAELTPAYIFDCSIILPALQEKGIMFSSVCIILNKLPEQSFGPMADHLIGTSAHAPHRPMVTVAAVALVVKVLDRSWHVMSSRSPVLLKIRRVGERCTLNLSRAQASTRWCDVVVRRGRCQLRRRPRHLTMAQNDEVHRQKPSSS